MANHGAFVSRKNEPSLKRLVAEITGGETEKEKMAQMLLDFVTQNIKFSSYEAFSGYEVLKRPNEVLMSGASDCSGLTILYASMLEQCDIDYILLYSKDHIAPALEGNFPVNNGQYIEYGGKIYTVAETTVKGFKIGESILQSDYSVKNTNFIQKPGEGSDMVKLK
jgi:hypothetical protein